MTSGATEPRGGYSLAACRTPLTYWSSRVRAAARCPPRPGGGSCHGADHGGLVSGASPGPGGPGRTRRRGRRAHGGADRFLLASPRSAAGRDRFLRDRPAAARAHRPGHPAGLGGEPPRYGRDDRAEPGLRNPHRIRTAGYQQRARGTVRAGPTPDRVRAALPSLILVAAVVAIRAGLQAAAGWAQSRLHPQVDRVVEIRLLDLTTRVELAAFDDAEFYDAMQRARDRGLYSAPQVVANVLDCVTGAVGIVSAALVVAVLQPILLVLLLLAELPGGWAAVRPARIGYITRFALADSHRRKWILTDLMAERRTAAEMRSFTLRHFMLARVARLAAYARDAQMKAAGRQALTRVTAQAAGGVAT